MPASKEAITRSTREKRATKSFHNYTVMLKDKPDGSFVMHFATNWLHIAHEQGLLVQHLVKAINMNPTTIYNLRLGSHTGYFSTYTLGLLAQLLDMDILEVINYAPYVPHVPQPRKVKQP